MLSLGLGPGRNRQTLQFCSPSDKAQAPWTEPRHPWKEVPSAQRGGGAEGISQRRMEGKDQLQARAYCLGVQSQRRRNTCSIAHHVTTGMRGHPLRSPHNVLSRTLSSPHARSFLPLSSQSLPDCISHSPNIYPAPALWC